MHDSTALATDPAPTTVQPERGRRRPRRRSRLSAALSLLACLVVWCAFVVPGEVTQLSAATFARIPLEGLVFVGVVLLVGRRWRRLVAVLVGLVLGLLVVLSVFDHGFDTFLDRPFDPLIDWKYLDSAVEVLADSVGHDAAVATAIAAGVSVVVVLVAVPLAALRVSGLVVRHRSASVRAVAALGLVWLLCAVAGLQLGSGPPVASVSAATVTYDQVSRIQANLADRRAFQAEVSSDDFADVPAGQLVSGLQGQGRPARLRRELRPGGGRGPSFSPGVAAVLDAGHRAGCAPLATRARSAWLTSPTFGAASWLAHATLQSGLWVDSQQRYDQLLDDATGSP